MGGSEKGREEKRAQFSVPVCQLLLLLYRVSIKQLVDYYLNRRRRQWGEWR